MEDDERRRRQTIRFTAIVLACGVALGVVLILILLAEYHLGPLR
jgi:ABC-type lipoprotein release transport system permease subunit